ncbi:succinate dehydrogenase assembly factor 2 [Rhodomicrobium lacus]|uniref:FAD assembly factor SdhE n=1 Tax=Rhodomicrobium lacus TaxID=2498452 RepID=UPI001FE1E671|nr:succinate dehydrogenase assembly factor 2 [Rhodomicrobium lacus]
MDGLELRRKRAVYRALHRGTKELDLILGRYAEARVPVMDETQLTSFETVLAAQDPDVDLWIRKGEAPGDLAAIVSEIRSFYRL